MSDIFRVTYALLLFLFTVGGVFLLYASPFLVVILLVKAQYELSLIFFFAAMFLFFTGNNKPRNGNV